MDTPQRRRTVIVKPLTHRGGEHYGLFFSYDQELIRLAKQVGCMFSWKKTCWYVPRTKENLNKLFNIFKGTAWLDITALKSDQTVSGAEQLPRPRILPQARLDELERFADWLRHKHYSENTIHTYIDCVRVYFQRYPYKDPKEITRDDFIQFTKEHIVSRGLSFSYQNQFVNALKLFLFKLHGVRIQTDILERPRKEHNLPNVLNKEEIQSLISIITNNKHKLLISLAYACGLRMGELLALKIKDIDFGRSIIHIRRAKGFRDRVVGLPIILVPLIREYIQVFKPMEWLFEGDKERTPYSVRSAQLVLKKYVKLAHINKPVTMHWLRHSYATHLMESGTDTRYIQALLGHKSIKTTEIYTHVSNQHLKTIPSPIDNIKL